MTIFEKLNLIQTKLKAPKGQYNSFGKYKYRSCEDILESVKPLLEETKTSLRLLDEIEQIGNRYYVRAMAILSDGENELKATAYAREPESKKGMDESQVTGTASSYARKYALNGLLAIDDTKDADTMDNREQTQSQQSAPRKQTAPAPKMKGGDSTPAEKEEMKKLLSSKKADGSAVFTREEMIAYSDMRAEKTAQEVIALIKAELQKRVAPLPEPVQAVKEMFDGEVVQPGFEQMQQVNEQEFEIF